MLGALGVLGFLLALPLAIYGIGSSRLDKDLLQSVLSRALSKQVEFHDYALSWRGSATIHGLTVSQDEVEILRAETTQVDFTWGSLLRGQPDVQNIDFQAPVITLDPERLEGLTSQSQGPAPPVQFERGTLHYGQRSWENLSGRFANNRLEVQQNDQKVALQFGSILEAELKQFSLATVGAPDIRLTGKAKLAEGRLQGEVQAGFEGREAQARFDLTAALPTQGQVELESSDWKVVALILYDHKELRVTDGVLSYQEQPFQFQATVGEQLALEVKGQGFRAQVSGWEPLKVAVFEGDRERLQGKVLLEEMRLTLSYLDGAWLAQQVGVEATGLGASGELSWEEGVVAHLQAEKGFLRGYPLASVEVVAKGGWTRLDELAVATDIEGGHLQVELTRNQENQPVGRFQFSGSETLPKLSGTGRLTAEALVLEPVQVMVSEPPVVASGRYLLESGQLEFETDLEGQSLATLYPSAPLGGLLFGTAEVRGTAAQPAFSFAGEVREASYQQLALGTIGVNLKGEEVEATIPRLALESVPQLKSLLKGAGSLTLKGTMPNFAVTFDYPQVSYEGQDLGRLHGSIRVRGDRYEVEKVVLPTSPPLTLAGMVEPDRLALQGEAEKLKLESLPLPLKIEGQASGQLSLTGTPEAPEGSFQGRVTALVYEGQKLGNVPLAARISPGQVTLTVEGLKVSQFPPLAEAVPGLSGTLTAQLEQKEKRTLTATLTQGQYGQSRLPTLAADLLVEQDQARLRSLRLETKPPLVVTGSFSTDKGTLTLGSTLDKFPIETLLSLVPGAPSLAGQLTGKFEFSGSRESTRASFQGQGSGLAFGTTHLGSAQLKLTGRSASDFEAQLSQLQASSVAPLAKLYPGLRGVVEVQAQSHPKGIGLEASLSQATVPALAGRAVYDGRFLQVEKLTVATEPPLVVKGKANQASLDFATQLTGQSLAQLMQVGGASPPPEVSANLHGSMVLGGSPSVPVLELDGPIRNLVYRRAQLGSGQLRLTAGQKLSGRLDLDQPYDASLADAASENVLRLPGVSDVLKRAATARVTGVTFSGTPQNPQVTPIVVAVGLPLKLPDEIPVRLPQQIELDSPVRIPGLDRKIKIKL